MVWANKVPTSMFHFIKKGGMAVKITKFISGEDTYLELCKDQRHDKNARNNDRRDADIKHSEAQRCAMANILIIDDDPSMRETLKLTLSGRGYSLAVASDGFEAISLAEQTMFDLIISDMAMPGINGLETYELIHFLDPTLKVIFMSGDANLDTYKEFNEFKGNGLAQFLLKPFKAAELMELVERMIATKAPDRKF